MIQSIVHDGDDRGDVTRISLADGASPDHIVIPDAHLLLSAHFRKAGADLILTGDDGKKLIVEGYFNLLKRPDLTAPDGGGLSADLVERLAISETPGQFAQVGAPAGAAVIGRVERVGGSATVQHANGVVQELQVGDNVLQGDVVQTSDGSQLGVSFIDGTVFNMGASARMVLSELIYSADSSSNSAIFSLVKGTISFVAGQAAKTGDMRVETPISTMGIRGTSMVVTVGDDVLGLLVTVSLMSDYDGHIGFANVLGPNNTLLSSINDPSTLSIFRPAGNNLTYLAQVINKPPEVVQQELAIAQIMFPMFLALAINTADAQHLQDLLPHLASVYTNSEIFTDTKTITETVSLVITPTQPQHGPPLPDIVIPTTTVQFIVPANFPPLINIDSSPHLIEAANGNPGIDTSVAPVIKSDLDGTASYDTAALAADHWDDLGNGIFSKLGSYGAATLDTVGAAPATLLAAGWTDLGGGIFQKFVTLHDTGGNPFGETVRVNSSANTLTYALDPVRSDPLHEGQIAENLFTIPVVDNDGGHNSAVATFTIEGKNDAPIAVDDAYSVALGQTLHITANSVLANDIDAEHDVLSASLQASISHDANVGFFSLVGGTLSTLNGNFNPPDWANYDGIGIGSQIHVFDSHSQAGQGLLLLGPSSVTFTFLGSEAGYQNAAFYDGQKLFLNHNDAVGATIGGLNADAGLLDFLFRSITPGNEDAVNGGPINPGVLLGLAVVSETRAYAFFKDIAAGDLDFDDMVVRIDVSPQLHTADGLLHFNSDGSFDYQPYFTGTSTFTYTANDGALDSPNTATVTIDVAAGPETFDFSSSAMDTQVTLSDTPGASFFVSATTGKQTLSDSIVSVVGGFGDDTIYGNNKGDTLNGGAGKDTIQGGIGNDILIGGAGNDQLAGGLGDDTFVFRPGFGHDTVTGFNVGDASHHDVLDLRGLGFTSVADVLNNTTDVGTSALIHVGADDISLQLVAKAALHTFDILV